MRCTLFLALVGLAAISSGCAEPSASDAGIDAGARDAGGDASIDDDASADASSLDGGSRDAGPADAGADAGSSCLDEGREVGERVPAGDACNFCECQPDGSTTCTARDCFESIGGCDYAGAAHAYGERFAATDGCNECVCAASGLACTRRACSTSEEGAILLENATTPCGENPAFTPARVLADLPVEDFAAPFLYDRARSFSPEVLADTVVRVRIVYDGGFLVCRIPSPTQPALDIQVTVEWITADGAFDEGFPAYLRRNDFGFVDAWWILGSAPLGGLNGSYAPICAIDPGDYAFEAQLEPDGHATGSVMRVCETDIALDVGRFDRPAP